MQLILFSILKNSVMGIHSRGSNRHRSASIMVRWGIAILLLFVVDNAYSQIRPDNHDRLYPTLLDKGSRMTDEQTQKVRTLFEIIESGITAGKVGSFSDQFDKQVFVNITKGENGYFSSEQASSLLQHYFSMRKVLSFKFSRSSEKGFTPYATGRLVTIYNGNQESAQVYVSCSWQNGEWVIGQFNIY
jgi:hypothetical protein